MFDKVLKTLLIDPFNCSWLVLLRWLVPTIYFILKFIVPILYFSTKDLQMIFSLFAFDSVIIESPLNPLVLGVHQ